MSAPALRGLFGRHRGSQGWFPGTDPALVSLSRELLEWAAPIIETAERLAVGDWPARRGAVWIRFVDGRWLIAHSAIPSWSHDRSIPAWALNVIDDAGFRAAPVLESMFDDVRTALADPERWLVAPPHARAAEGAVPFGDGVLRAACSMFECSQRPSTDGAFHSSRSNLDAPGWIALQAMLCAMATAGVQHVAAVVVFEPMPVSTAFPAFTQCFEDGATPWPECEVPLVRGVEMSSFIRSFCDLVAAFEHAVSAAGSVGAPVSLGAALGRFVPIGLVDPIALDPNEAEEWARAVAAHDSSDHCHERLNELSALLADPVGGDSRLAAPFVRLLEAWVAKSPVDRGPEIRRLLAPVLFRLGPAR
jgi:hypothetical protein